MDEIIFNDEIPFKDEIRLYGGWVDLISSTSANFIRVKSGIVLGIIGVANRVVMLIALQGTILNFEA